MRPAKDTERHIRDVYANGLKVTAGAGLDERVLNNMMETLEELERRESAAMGPSVWRSIMQSRVAKLTAAAVIVMVAILGIAELAGIDGGSSVAWADVVEPILHARTASFDFLIGSGENQASIHDEVMGSRIRRTMYGPMGPVIIIDLDQQKMVTLNHAGKTAITVDLNGLDSVKNIKNYLDGLRNSVIRFEDNPNFYVENQGLQEIDGRELVVFVAHGDNETITIWADPQTALPIRIEQETPNMHITCENLQFDIELEESQFSIEIPDGYTIQAGGINFKDASESDFVESLRIWAEIFEDGHFPDRINLGDIVRLAPMFAEGLQRAGLTQEEQLDVATKWGQGLVFIRFFKGQGEWHYAGQGVKLGDGSKPIFWYQPQDSQTWRVIYGDLRVEEVVAEDLPQ